MHGLLLYIQDLVDDYHCACVEGWEGKDCGEERDECMTGPCINGDCRVCHACNEAW